MASKVDEATSYDNDVAIIFDRLSERYTARYVEHACSVAGVHAGEQILDVGTGTGIMSRALGSRLGGSGKVLGVDIAEGMLVQAEKRGRKLGLVPHIVKYALGDAEDLEVADSSVDLVTSLFVLRHLPNVVAAVKEMRRVLRPEGRIVIGVGGRPPLSSLRGMLHRQRRIRYFTNTQFGLCLSAPSHLLSLLDAHLSDEDRLDGTEGYNQLGRHTTRRLKSLLRQVGFGELRTSWRGYIDRIDDPQEFWELQLYFSSAARYRVLGASPEEVESLREVFLRECDVVLKRGGSLVYPHGAVFVTGRLRKDS